MIELKNAASAESASGSGSGEERGRGEASAEALTAGSESEAEGRSGGRLTACGNSRCLGIEGGCPKVEMTE